MSPHKSDLGKGTFEAPQRLSGDKFLNISQYPQKSGDCSVISEGLIWLD